MKHKQDILLTIGFNAGLHSCTKSYERQVPANLRMASVILTLVFPILFYSKPLLAQEKTRIVHVAKLQIDSTKLGKYKAALQEEIEASNKIEPGVLTLYAVSEKINPNHILVFEIYADSTAYASHLKSVHFKKYKRVTMNMVKSLELIDVDPVVLKSKCK